MLTNLEDSQSQVFRDSSIAETVADFTCLRELAKLLKALDSFNSRAPGMAKAEESAMQFSRTDKKSKPEGTWFDNRQRIFIIIIQNASSRRCHNTRFQIVSKP